MNFRVPAIALLLLTGVPLMAQTPNPAIEGVSSQVRPVSVWLMAVKDADQERLKTAFSESMRQQFDREGWDTS